MPEVGSVAPARPRVWWAVGERPMLKYDSKGRQGAKPEG